MQWEGEDAPELSDEDRIALRAVKVLANGHGGIDWAGLPIVCEWLGVTDIDGLLRRITIIKGHDPKRED